MTAGITGATRVHLHLAHPSAYARTPQVMNAEFARRGVDAVAVSADVAPGDLGGFARGLHGWRNLAGLSVTMPYKEALAAHVDELAGPTALIGAVNVVRRESDGRLVGGTPTGRRIWYLRRYRILRAGHFLHANSRFCSDSDGLAGRDHGYVGGEDFAAFVVEVADVDRAGGAAYPAEHAGALGAGQVLVTPLLQGR